MIKRLLKLYLCCITLLITTQAYALGEEEAGQQFYRMLQQQVHLIRDPIANDYINHLGFRLVAYSQEPDAHFFFFIVSSSDINAFAGPDGYIGVNSGLFITTSTESELASVLAHEISHVTQHHIQRGNEKMSQLTVPAIAAIVAGIASGNPAIAAGSITAVTGGAAQYNINTTRSYEREADAIGIQTLAKAGFNPDAMAAFFERMQEESRYESTVSPLLQTHPVTQERIAEAENRAHKYPKKTYHSSAQYNLVKARLIVSTASNQQKLLGYATRKYEKNKKNQFYHYQYALALAGNRQYDKAVTELASLSKQYPNQIIYPYTQAEVLIHDQKYHEANNILAKVYTYNSHYYPLVMLYAQSLIRDKQAAKAVELLENYQIDYLHDMDFWGLFSKAEAENNNLIYAYIYRAKAYALYGNYRSALVQLQMALKQPNNTPYTKAVIQADLKKVRSKLKTK